MRLDPVARGSSGPHVEERTSRHHPSGPPFCGGFPHSCLRMGGGGRGGSSILQQLDPSAGQIHTGDYPVGPEEQMVPTITCSSDPLYIASGYLGVHQACLSLSNAPSQLGEACPQPVVVDGVTSPAVNPIVYLKLSSYGVSCGRLPVA